MLHVSRPTTTGTPRSIAHGPQSKTKFVLLGYFAGASPLDEVTPVTIGLAKLLLGPFAVPWMRYQNPIASPESASTTRSQKNVICILHCIIYEEYAIYSRGYSLKIRVQNIQIIKGVGFVASLAFALIMRQYRHIFHARLLVNVAVTPTVKRWSVLVYGDTPYHRHFTGWPD